MRNRGNAACKSDANCSPTHNDTSQPVMSRSTEPLSCPASFASIRSRRRRKIVDNPLQHAWDVRNIAANWISDAKLRDRQHAWIGPKDEHALHEWLLCEAMPSLDEVGCPQRLGALRVAHHLRHPAPLARRRWQVFRVCPPA
eukprot:7350179-Prymnesium_polylepis.2